jgi:hypothetical protein
MHIFCAQKIELTTKEAKYALAERAILGHFLFVYIHHSCMGTIVERDFS